MSDPSQRSDAPRTEIPEAELTSAVGRLRNLAQFKRAYATTRSVKQDAEDDRNDANAIDLVLSALLAGQRDGERLDWVESEHANVKHIAACANYPEFWAIELSGDAEEYAGEGFSLREAIDDAIESERAPSAGASDDA